MVRFLLVVAILVSYTAYKAVQLWPSQRLLAAVLSLLLFALMFAGPIVHRADPAVFELKWFQALSWGAALAMAFWATFVILSLPVDLLALAARGIAKLTDPSDFDPTKRATLMRGLYLSVFGISGGLVGLGFAQVLRGPKLKHVSVPVADLPASLNGLKIVQISDLHVGATIRKGYVEEMVERANSATPDLVFVTGDLSDALAESIEEHLMPLGGLKARYGLYFVTGNHEYYWHAPSTLARMTALGFKTLINENVVIDVGGSKLLVAGVTDPAGENFYPDHKPNLAKAFAHPEETHFKVLLAHRPSESVEAEQIGFDLQFSGHTHGGQFFPFNLFIGLAHRYSRGLYRHGRMWVHVNPGTGYWGPADRLGVGAEITVASLKASAQAPA